MPSLPGQGNASDTKPPAAILDLDGTIALFDGQREWFDYELCDGDRVCEAVKTVVEALAVRGIAIVVLTGRPNAFRGHTVEWLARNNVPFDVLLMRLDHDRTSNRVFKRDVYERMIAPTYDVLMAFEDNPKTVEMWRELGITTFALPANPAFPENKPT
jgi:hydroxymethylpyrimidine pyrophosphatase-like HAD family hydrolase